MVGSVPRIDTAKLSGYKNYNHQPFPPSIDQGRTSRKAPLSSGKLISASPITDELAGKLTIDEKMNLVNLAEIRKPKVCYNTRRFVRSGAASR